MKVQVGHSCVYSEQTAFLSRFEVNLGAWWNSPSAV